MQSIPHTTNDLVIDEPSLSSASVSPEEADQSAVVGPTNWTTPIMDTQEAGPIEGPYSGHQFKLFTTPVKKLTNTSSVPAVNRQGSNWSALDSARSPHARLRACLDFAMPSDPDETENEDELDQALLAQRANSKARRPPGTHSPGMSPASSTASLPAAAGMSSPKDGTSHRRKPQRVKALSSRPRTAERSRPPVVDAQAAAAVATSGRPTRRPRSAYSTRSDSSTRGRVTPGGVTPGGAGATPGGTDGVDWKVPNVTVAGVNQAVRCWVSRRQYLLQQQISPRT